MGRWLDLDLWTRTIAYKHKPPTQPIVFPLVWIPLKTLQTAALTLVWRDVRRNPLTPAVAAFVLHLCLGATTAPCEYREERKPGLLT